ncbi:LysR substrate-binding domain-containing protein [Mesorhizobium shangrilense]|uniref:LysR substrate-binding domain-containing protein n=1 Tax=Mesorhizobium shangrilense TaxID=460060 RepID=A0ABV2DQX6_9HYPH
MVHRHYDLPSLTALAVFEASARHLSFNLAASELNVTPSAVSRQIKAIEDELGVPLFVRLGSVMLTSAGEDLYAVLASSLSEASHVTRALKRGDRSKNVSIACTYSFASMWLIPRMSRFWTKYGDVTVDHLISDNSRDFRRAEVDLRIRYGFGSWPDETAEFLFDELIYPVCGPGFARKHRNATAESLPELPLLHGEWVNTEWTGWDELFRRAGIPHGPLRGRRFSKFFVTLQAAQADQGVAVGWHRLVRPLLEEVKLVKITDLELPAPGGWYVTWNYNRTLSPAAELLRGWLREISPEERGA